MSSDADPLAGGRVQELLGQPESKTLEFKTDLGDPEQAAQLFAAMANSGGGQVVVGVNDDQGPVGLANLQRTLEIAEQAAKTVEPSVPMTVEEEAVDGHEIVVVELQPKEDQGIFVPPDGAIRRRDGQGRSVVLSGSELVREAVAAGGDRSGLERLLGEMNRSLEKLQEKADEASKDAKEARSLRAQLPGWFFGGLIGAAIGVAATAVLGQ